MKCPSCGKEFYCDHRDIDPIEQEDLSLLCPFCVTKSFNKGTIGTHLCYDDIDNLETIDLGNIIFDDQSKLDEAKIKSITEQVEKILHEIENLKGSTGDSHEPTRSA
jgi:hypothetical protein